MKSANLYICAPYGFTLIRGLGGGGKSRMEHRSLKGVYWVNRILFANLYCIAHHFEWLRSVTVVYGRRLPPGLSTVPLTYVVIDANVLIQTLTVNAIHYSLNARDFGLLRFPVE